MEFPQIGDVFEGRYELLQVLGKGSFATVFLANDREMSRNVVIKALRPDERLTGDTTTVVKRFEREARIFTQLQDPHNITVYDVGQAESGLLYMIFEYVPGQELAALLQDRGRLEPMVVAHILTQLLQALREAHELVNILHRDIKPANVLIYEYDGDPYRVKLLDYGIAKELRGDAVNLTRTGHVVGTLRYMAPEQIVGEQVGPWSDLYSLGLVGYELLCGVPAIGGQEQRDILLAQIAPDRLAIPPEFAPASLRAVIERMMARDAAARYQSASDVLRDLAAIRDDVLHWSGVIVQRPSSSSSAVVTAPTPPTRPRPMRTWWLAAIAVAAVALGVAAGLLLLRPSEAPPPPRARVVTIPTTPPRVTPSDTVEVSEDVGTPRTDGCGQAPPFHGLGELSASALGPRWTAYVPKNYDPNRRYPLVLMYHRRLRTGTMIITQSRMDEVADRHGAIVIAPDSPDSFGWPLEAALTASEEAVAAAHEQLCVDMSRQYALGDDKGASALRRLMCIHPFSAAVFAFDGLVDTCEPVARTPRLRSYGRRDRNVPEKGGMGCNPLENELGSATEIENAWKAQYGCRGPSKKWGEFAGGECWVYRDCDVAPLVTCATDGGHQWPGTPPTLEAESCKYERPKVPFPHAEAAWQFFEEFGVELTTEELPRQDDPEPR